MQFHDGGDQAEAETQPGVAAAFIGTVEASRDEIAFARSDAGSIVADTYHALVAHAIPAKRGRAPHGSGQYRTRAGEKGSRWTKSPPWLAHFVACPPPLRIAPAHPKIGSG
jgi:hypothetical protein